MPSVFREIRHSVCFCVVGSNTTSTNVQIYINTPCGNSSNIFHSILKTTIT
jgi:hypothetical protein